MILEYVYYIIFFSIFTVLQSMAINGINTCFKGTKVIDDATGKVSYDGMIFYMIAPKFFEKYRYSYWSKPIWSCVRCMSSIWGGITYWPFIIYLFNFKWIEFPIYLIDVMVLISINWYIYKKL